MKRQLPVRGLDDVTGVVVICQDNSMSQFGDLEGSCLVFFMTFLYDLGTICVEFHCGPI